MSGLANPFRDQAAFMALAGQTTDQFDYPQYRRYIAHVLEEVAELHKSTHPVTHIDALVDLIVVAIGALISLGVDPQQAWDIVHRANLSKVDGSLGPIVRRPDGQIGKPPGWQSPEPELFKLAQQAGLINAVDPTDQESQETLHD